MTQTTASKLIRVGHSPDPDDAFMFYALAKNKIPMYGFQVEHVIEDIESLNQRALGVGAFRETPRLEVTAVSCHAYAYLADKYIVMRAGSSVGDNYGPILVVPENSSITSIKGKRVAVPGKLTTAYLAIQLFDADQGGSRTTPTFETVFIPFDEIFDAVKAGKADVGLIIHEGQITFQKQGFKKLVDLGQWWYAKHKLPLPLGVDIIRRDLGPETVRTFAKLFKESIQYALDHRQPALEYAKQYGRGISDDLNDRFVGMYVNDLTVDLGDDGIKGFQLLLEEAFQKGLLPHQIKLEFI